MVQTTTTTTITTDTSTRTDQSLVVGTTTSSYNLGNYVTDVSVNPYMATTLISFVAYNMRPSTLMHVFFNNVLVDQYCAPSVLNPNPNVDSSSPLFTLQTANFGTPIYSDANGNVIGLFLVPATTFKTGSLALEICDSANLVLGNNAITTSAFATFTASNITVTKSSTTLTTVNPVVSVANTIDFNISTNVASTTSVQKDIVNFTTFDPVAQVFQFNTPNGEAGAYLTSIDLFFFQKSLTNPNNGFLLYVCETAVGYPDSSNILPFSSTHISGQQINVSNDASIATRVTFESPVFVNADTPYAFIVKPDQSDPDILIYLASLGDVDITTGQQVFSQPNIGTAYEGAVTSAWTALPSKYIKFNVNRANFTSSNSVVYFNETNRDHLKIVNISYSNNTVSIQPGDFVYSAVNSSIATVNTSTIATANYYNITLGTLSVEIANGTFQGNSYIQVHRFANNSTAIPTSNSLIATANLTSVDNIKMNTCVPRVASIEPAGTHITWSAKATNNTYTIDSSYFPVNLDSSNELLDYERIVMSRSNEIANLSGNKSFSLQANMTSDSSYLSPLIDTIRNDLLAVRNLVDPLTTSVYDEMFNYGKAQTKYLSLPVTLASGQDAENLQVSMDAYKPYASYIRVYAKFLNSQDTDSLTNKTWTPLNSDTDSFYSQYNDTADYINLTFSVAPYYQAFSLSGTISTTGNVVIGTNTLFTTQLAVGRYINVLGDRAQKITSISNNTYMTVANSFNNNYVGNTALLVPPSTTAWLSLASSTQIIGTVTANTSSNIITGNNTTFSTSFAPGSIIQIGTDEQVIVNVTNNTSLSVGSNWSSTVNNVAAYNTTLAGLNYLNNNNNLYTNFNQFQIKIVLLSNDTSKVPIMKDVTAIALQQ